MELKEATACIRVNSLSELAGCGFRNLDCVAHSDDSKPVDRGLALVHEIKENVMDLNLIAMIQHQPVNQFKFDPEALDRAILHAEKRRAYYRSFWSQLATRLGQSIRKMRLFMKVATPTNFG